MIELTVVVVLVFPDGGRRSVASLLELTVTIWPITAWVLGGLLAFRDRLMSLTRPGMWLPLVGWSPPYARVTAKRGLHKSRGGACIATQR